MQQQKGQNKKNDKEKYQDNDQSKDNDKDKFKNQQKSQLYQSKIKLHSSQSSLNPFQLSKQQQEQQQKQQEQQEQNQSPMHMAQSFIGKRRNIQQFQQQIQQHQEQIQKQQNTSPFYMEQSFIGKRKNIYQQQYCQYQDQQSSSYLMTQSFIGKRKNTQQQNQLIQQLCKKIQKQKSQDKIQRQKQQKMLQREYQIHISNLTDNQNIIQTFRCSPKNKYTIRYQDINQLLIQNYPQYQPQTQMCIMCYNQNKGIWEYLTKHYYYQFDHNNHQQSLKIHFEVILFTQDDQFLYYYPSQEQMMQYQQKTLSIQRQIQTKIKKLSNLIQNTQKYQDDINRAISYQPLDIHIFWASPLYTDDQYDRKLLNKYKKVGNNQNQNHHASFNKSISHNYNYNNSNNQKSLSSKKSMDYSIDNINIVNNNKLNAIIQYQRKHSMNIKDNNNSLHAPGFFQSHSFDHSHTNAYFHSQNFVHSQSPGGNTNNNHSHSHSSKKSQKLSKSQQYNNILKRSFNKQHETVLRNTVKYPFYIQTVIKTLRKSHKYTQLFIDNFNFNTFKHHNKKRFSIVYLICHTQVAQEKYYQDDSDQFILPGFQNKKSKNSVQSQTIKEEKREYQNEEESDISKSQKGSKIKQKIQSLHIKREDSFPMNQCQMAQSLEVKIESPMQDFSENYQLPSFSPSPIHDENNNASNNTFSHFLLQIPKFKKQSQQEKQKKQSSGQHQQNSSPQHQSSKQNSSSHQYQAPQELKKNITQDVLSQSLNKFTKTYSSYSDQTKAKQEQQQKQRLKKGKSHNLSFNKGSNKKNNGQNNSNNNKKKTRVKYYFVGQDAHGKMVHITPQKLKDMLESKNIQMQLLILHSSYPFYHSQIFRKHAKNIILINSNPILPDQSVNFFLEKYLSHLMYYKSIHKAYMSTIIEIQQKYPGFQCCCYHEHSDKCQSKYNMNPSKYDGYHYRYHIDRCNCSQKDFLKHFCPDKYKLYSRDYKNGHRNEGLDMIDQFFYCCCKTEKDLAHSHRKKFQDYKLQHPDKLTSQPQILDIADGKLQEKGNYFDSFCKQSQLIGNQQLLINLLKVFDTESIVTLENKVTIFNIYGIPKTGKKYIARHFANLLIRKTQGYFMGWKQVQIQYIKDISKTQDNIFYIFVHKSKAKKNLKIQRKGDHAIIPKTLNAIIVTQRQIMTDQHYLPASQTQPFEHQQQCGSYIKLNSKFNQQMKDKLKNYLRQTLRSQLNYYPRTFEKDQIILALKRSKYDNKYKNFFASCVGIPIIDLVFISNACAILEFRMNYNQIQKRNGKHKNADIIFQIQKLKAKSKQKGLIQSQDSLLTFQNLSQYQSLIYQVKKGEIARYAIDIIKIYVQRTVVRDEYCRFLQVTTINPNSYISQYLKKQIKLIKTQQIRIKSQDNTKLLDVPKYSFSNNRFQHRKIVFESALQFLHNALLTHTIFSYLNFEQRQILIRYGILLINNIILQQKNKSYYQQNLQLTSSVSLQLPFILNNSISLQQQQENQMVNLQSMSLTSRKGLIYLLDRLITHIPYQNKFTKNHLKIICQELKIQIYFQSKYQSQKLHQNFNQEIQNTIFRIVQRQEKILQLQQKDTLLTYILEYDFVLSLTLLYTNCGRQPMTKFAQKMIKRAKKQGNIPSKLIRGISMGYQQIQKQSIRAKLLSKMCSDKNLYNRLINNLNPSRDQQGNFDQLQIYQQILLKWDLLSKCDPQDNPLQAYHILINMNKQIRNKLKGEILQQSIQQKMGTIYQDQQRQQIQSKSYIKTNSKRYYQQHYSHYLQCLISDLQKKFEQKFNKLNKKLFVWMQANPIPNKKTQAILDTRYLIKNTIIEQFNLQSQTKRKMLSIKIKLNRQYLHKLKQLKGCRFLCLDLNLNKNDQTQIIGQTINSDLQKINQNQIASLLEQIPVINLFICFRKPISLIKYLKEGYNLFKKDIVYFDFNALLQNQLKLPQLKSSTNSIKLQKGNISTSTNKSTNTNKSIKINKKSNNIQFSSSTSQKSQKSQKSQTTSIQTSYKQNKKSLYYVQKMIMMTVIKQIIQRMHFHRLSIVDAFQRTIDSLQFQDNHGNIIMKNDDLKKVTFLHSYGQFFQNSLNLIQRQSKDQHFYDPQSNKKIIKLSLQNVFESYQLQKVQQITRVCFPNHFINRAMSFSKSKSSDGYPQIQLSHSISLNLNNKSSDLKLIKIQFPCQRLITALIQYLKLKQNFHHYIIMDLQQCYKNDGKNIGLFKKMKQDKILDLYYTAKKGILIFLNTQLISQRGQKWQKQEFDKLFARPDNSQAINSIRVPVQSTYKNKKQNSDILIAFFDRISQI